MTLKTFALTFLFFLIVAGGLWFGLGMVAFAMGHGGEVGWIPRVCGLVCMCLTYSEGFWEMLVGWQYAVWLALPTTALTLTILLHGGIWLIRKWNESRHGVG